jgi:hypothetical protein
VTVANPFPFWDDPNQSWDTLRLGGNTFPGAVNVDGEVSRDVEVKKSKGQDGATIKDNGYVPAPVDIALRLWTQEHWTSFQRLLPTIHPRSQGGTRTPVSIGHPAPNLFGIKDIYVKKIGFPKLGDDKVFTIIITAMEWLPKPKPVKKAAGGGGGSGQSGQGNSDDDLRSELEALENEADDYDDYASAYDEALEAWKEEQEGYGPLNDPYLRTDEEREDAFEDSFYDEYYNDPENTATVDDDDIPTFGDDGENVEDLADFEEFEETT